MDDISYEEHNRGKNSLVAILVIGLIITALVLGFFTTFKQETLICNVKNDTCSVQKTNIAGFKYNKKLVKLSEIANISLMPQKVKGNRYAKGYTSYFLTFIDKNNNPIIIFSTDYYEKEEIDAAIRILKHQFKNNNGEIYLNRN